MATASFVSYLQRPRELLPVPEFRAPPPSPVTGVLTGSSSGSSEYGESQDDDDEIGRFLRCSARVPVLRLPDGPLPRRKKKMTAWAPPVIDMRHLELGVEALKSAGVAFGCFQVVGHGVHRDMVQGTFRAAPKREGWSTPEAMEEIGGDEDVEELWWPPSEGEHDMARKSNVTKHFRNKNNRADDLFTQLEQIATKLMRALQQGSAAAGTTTEPLAVADTNGSRLCIRKHHRGQPSRTGVSGPLSQGEVLRMLVRGSRYSRALAIHLCPGASAFHVFSRRGWSRFRPLDGAAVVTVGDRLQEWSRGFYKGVSGRPAYSSDDFQRVDSDDYVSAEFILSCSPAVAAKEATNAAEEKVIPLTLQIMIAAGLVLIYHFLLSFLYAFRG